MSSAAEARARMIARRAHKPFDEAAWRRSQQRQDEAKREARLDRLIDQKVREQLTTPKPVGSQHAARAKMIQRAYRQG